MENKYVLAYYLGLVGSGVRRRESWNRYSNQRTQIAPTFGLVPGGAGMAQEDDEATREGLRNAVDSSQRDWLPLASRRWSGEEI